MTDNFLADIGSVVFCQFPTEEGGKLAHYALVVAFEEDLHGVTYTLAYGSSRKVSIDGHLPHEFVLAHDPELRIAGLSRPTRFDLRKTRRFLARDFVVVGNIPMLSEVIHRLRLAALAAASP